jgi:hypothetical protein
MGLRNLAAVSRAVSGGIKVSLTSDGYSGKEIPFTGYEKVMAIVTGMTPSTSVAVLTFSFQKNVVTDISTDGVASDWAVFGSDCSVVAAAFAASTTQFCQAVDITIPSSDSGPGMLRCVVLTPGEGLTIDGLAITYVMYGGSGQWPTTDWAPVYWPVPA